MQKQINLQILADISSRAPERDRQFFTELQKRAARGEIFDSDDDAYNARMLQEFEKHIHLDDSTLRLERAELDTCIKTLARAALRHRLCDPDYILNNPEPEILEDICRDVIRTVLNGKKSKELFAAFVVAIQFLKLPEEIA